MRFAPELAEGFGTFSLVLGGCAAIATQSTHGGIGALGVALAFGLVVLAMVHTLGHVSGAHINPAVTIAFAATHHFPWRRVPGYIVAQTTGATAAAFLVNAWYDAPHGATRPGPGVALADAFAIEFVASALLMFVIASVATDGRAIGATAGLAIGGTVALDAMWAGALTGASMNPARSIGPALAAGDPGTVWIYIGGPLLGMLVGAAAYEAVRRGARPIGRRAEVPA